LTEPFPYLWLDATFPHVREDGRVAPQALMIAIGVDAHGRCRILGLDIGCSENGAHWTAFLRSLVDRGLHGAALPPRSAVTAEAAEKCGGEMTPSRWRVPQRRG
jgi:transposase-like protein